MVGNIKLCSSIHLSRFEVVWSPWEVRQCGAGVHSARSFEVGLCPSGGKLQNPSHSLNIKVHLQGIRFPLVLALLHQRVVVVHWWWGMSWTSWHPTEWKQKFFKHHPSLSWESACTNPVSAMSCHSLASHLQNYNFLFPKPMKTSVLSTGHLIIVIVWLISRSPNASGCSEKP